MPSISDYLSTVSGSYLAPQTSRWVRLVNNLTSTAYVSTTATDATGLYTILNVPPGLYTVSTSTNATGPWTATGDTNYEVAPTNLGLYNVMDYGAVGDGVHDDYPAIWAAINDANASGVGSIRQGTVVFPPGRYLVNTLIDLSSRGYVKFWGLGGPGLFDVQFGYPPMAEITAGAGLTSVVRTNYGTGTLNCVFENMAFTGCEIPVYINAAASAKFINCGFAPTTGSNASNCGVCLLNTFWIRFERCAIAASSTSKPSVNLAGDATSPNVAITYFVSFVDTVLNKGGVYYQQVASPGGTVVTDIVMERVDTENFTNMALLTVTPQGPGSPLTLRHLAFYNCTQSDQAGSSPYLKVNDGANVQSVVLIGCPTAGGDAVVTAGTGKVIGMINHSPRGGLITAPSANMQFVQTRDGSMDFVGSLGNGGGAITNAMSAWTQDASPALRMGKGGEANAMYGLERDGSMYWGPGGAGGGWDAKVYRKAAGSVGTDTALFCGSGATGSRPSASTVGAGAMWFDTSLVKPIWSNGSVWKDATGTTV